MEKVIKKYKLLNYSQPGGNFYACVIPANEIVSRLEIRRRSQYPKSGIQRDENSDRLREIERYSRVKDAVFPTPIIVSASSEYILVEDDELLIPTDLNTVGHILDGQHRVLGLLQAGAETWREFDLLLVFVFDVDPYSEATIFATINGNQKQVSKSLMYDLFDLNPGRSIEKTCHEIVKSLNEDEKSPFYKRIKILGKKMGDKETLSQAAFIDQIKRQIKMEDGPLFPFYKSNEDWAIRKIIDNCFRAVETEIWQSNGNFPKDYFFRTTGFGGLAQALNDLVLLGTKHGDISENYFLAVMRNYFYVHREPPKGVGNSAMLEIKRGLLEAAKRATPNPKTNAPA